MSGMPCPITLELGGGSALYCLLPRGHAGEHEFADGTHTDGSKE